MTSPYTYSVLKVAVAQICQKIGWHAVHQSSLELIVDILDKYLKTISKTTHDYVELYNRTEFNLDDLGLAFRDLGINISDIEEYVQYVDPIVPAIEVPKFPVKKESHLNFLKPGSKEVLTRPVYIPEHLPPINPPEEEELLNNGTTNEKDVDVSSPGDDNSNGVFKRPTDTVYDGNSSKKPKMSFEDEVRPIREITSVIMTTSGFISPAREGKLPESKAPHIAPEYKQIVPPPLPSVSTFIKHQQQNQNNQQINVVPIGSEKKLEKKFKKKNHDKEKKKPKKIDALKDEPSQFMFNPMAQIQPNPALLSLESPPKPTKKINEKKLLKVPKKHRVKKNQPIPGELFQVVPKTKRDKLEKQKKLMQEITLNETMFKLDQPPKNLPPQQPVQAHSFLTGSLSLSGSLHDSMHPFPLFASPPALSAPLIDGKLSTEPDKQKLNIFKKISSSAKNKDDYGNTSKYNQPPLDFSSPHKFDRSELDHHILNNPHSISKKNRLPKPQINEEMPLNMSMSRSQVSGGVDSMYSMEDLSIPRTPNFARTPEMKRDSTAKKKRKEKKEKKGKDLANFPDMGNFLNKLQGTEDQSHNFLSNPPDLAQSMMLQAKIAGLTNPNLLFPFPNLVFPPGPGLIPNHPSMFQQFNPMQQQFPFGHPSTKSHEMGNLMNYNHSQKERNEPNMYASTSGMAEKSFCNVASLIPPSLSIELVPKTPKEQPKIYSNVSNFSKHNEITKKVEEIDTYDLTKDSSPEPSLPPPKVPTPTIPVSILPSVAPIEIALDDFSCKIKEKKEKKRDKKDKEGKIKKKKDKKDKIKNKERKEGKEKSKKEKKEKRKDKDRASSVASAFDSQNDTDTCDNNSTSSSVPKLTLKLGASNSPRPNTPDSHKKFSVKTKRDEFSSPSSSHTLDSLHMGTSDHLREREASPEMMKISALVTRPPKQKPSKKREEDLQPEPTELDDVLGKEGMSKARATAPGGDAADVQVKHKNSAKKKPPTGNTADNIRDADGNEVWICPACGRVDDGTPMIGCDGCDAWYHWQCVGIFIPPDQTEDWYCRVCIGKKQKGELSEEKKKKRKKKDKKEH